MNTIFLICILWIESNFSDELIKIIELKSKKKNYLNYKNMKFNQKRKL